jgi:hypothetical protein
LQGSQKIATVEQKLARGWGGENAYHVGGYRYLLVDPDRRVSRASPAGKVTTLSRVCPFALSKFLFESVVYSFGKLILLFASHNR